MIQPRHGQPDVGTDAPKLWADARGRFVDLHCHCLPNLDDGPASLCEALALCQALVADGIGLVVATPHQLGRFEGHTPVELNLETTQWLNRELANNRIDLLVLPGAEVRLDERIGSFLTSEDVLTLADMNQYILLELPDDLFIDIEPLLVELRARNIATVIAHAERNAPLLKHMDRLERWLRYGVRLQITAASVTGRFGHRIYRAAWQLIVEGKAAVIASDAHDCRTNRLCMTEAFGMVEDAFGRELALLLFQINPRRVALGQELIEMCAWSEGALQ